MTDTRKDPVSIALTMEEWDSLGFGVHPNDGSQHAYADTAARRYAQSLDWKARKTIAEATPGAAERRAAALAEIEASRPVLDNDAKAAIREELRYLLVRINAGSINVDHLGHGPDHRYDRMPAGYDVTYTPHICGGGSAFCFRLRPDLWFEGKQLPLLDEEREWFVKAVKRLAGKVVSVWNDGPSPWVSVQFR